LASRPDDLGRALDTVVAGITLASKIAATS
jgi:hypothetical protein